MEIPANSFAVRCFHGPDIESVAGNLALVSLPTDTLPWSNLSADALGDATRVSVTAKDKVWQIDSYGPAGRQIDFCGHGALAGAFALFDNLETNRIACRNHQHSWEAWRTDDACMPVALGYAAPEIAAVAVPDFLRECLGLAPAKAGYTANPQGYCIAELEKPADIAHLQPDLAALSRASQRALIVTALDREATELSCVFRYFAPQYGTEEDSATGSAAVQLATWWRPVAGDKPLQLRQLSATGGAMQVRCNRTMVELRGRVAYG